MTPVTDLLAPADRLGDAEVGQLHLALPAEQHVLGGDVAVDDPQRAAVARAGVDVGQRPAERRHDVERQRQRHLDLRLDRAPAHLLEAPAVDELQDQEVLFARLAEVEHLHEVAVVQAGGDVGLVDQHAHEVGSAASAGRMRLNTTGFWKPSAPPCRARKISAIPPWAILLRTR